MNKTNKTKNGFLCGQGQARVLLRICLAGVISVAGLPPVVQASDDYEYTVTADIATGTCTPDVTPSSLVLPSVDPSELELGTVHSLTGIKVSFVCQGSGEAGKTPSLHIAGTPVQSSGGNNDGDYLFRDATSQVAGVGFVLSKKNTDIWDTQDLYKVNTDVPLMPQPGSTYDGTSLDMYAGVACGGRATCESDYTPVANNTGNVSAIITLTFAYK